MRQGRIFNDRGELLVEYEYDTAEPPVPIINLETGTITVPGAKSITVTRRLIEGPRPDELFEKFWTAYPKKRSKGQAKKAWAKLKFDGDLFETIMSALSVAKTSREWQKKEGTYIPYPATWLNAEGWNDEMEPAIESRDETITRQLEEMDREEK